MNLWPDKSNQEWEKSKKKIETTKSTTEIKISTKMIVTFSNQHNNHHKVLIMYLVDGKKRDNVTAATCFPFEEKKPTHTHTSNNNKKWNK